MKRIRKQNELATTAEDGRQLGRDLPVELAGAGPTARIFQATRPCSPPTAPMQPTHPAGSSANEPARRRRRWEDNTEEGEW